jgi:hypothetical protein
MIGTTSLVREIRLRAESLLARPTPGSTVRPADPLDTWLDTLHGLAQRSGTRRATERTGRRLG